jgi:hypothetical protein
MYSIGQAARATGKSKSVIHTAIKKGTISATKNEDGTYAIDPSELHRVFPPVSFQNGVKEPDSNVPEPSEPGDFRFENGRLKGELEELRERLAAIDIQHERERQQFADQIEDLRRRLDQSEQERRDKDRQLTALLTDQSRKPAPEPERPARRGFRVFLHRLTG